MARYVEIDRADLQKLLDGYGYVIERYSASDPALCDYLKEILTLVQGHLANEAQGTAGNETFSEIEFILNFFGDPNGQDGDPSRS